jgi:nitrous oxide reductase accessory protein NosL
MVNDMCNFPDKKNLVRGGILSACFFAFLLSANLLLAQPSNEVSPQERCSVCGMFVSKYPNWLTQVRLADNSVKFFDGVKDLLAFYFDPASFGTSGQTIKEIWVKDYYTLAWLDGRSAWYVLGSDIYGPMGHELIPFGSAAAAANFHKDHKGTKVLRFAEITESLVQSMRHGQKMH